MSALHGTRKRGIGRGIGAGALAAALMALSGCPEAVTPQTAARDFAIDVPNRIFNAQDLADVAARGLGVETVSFTLHLDDGSGADVPVAAELRAANIVATYDYTQIVVEIEGELTSIDAVAGDFAATISGDDADEDWSLHGWDAFANILKIKTDYVLNSTTPTTSIFRLLPCPRGGSAPTVRVDSGLQATGEGLTDRAADLVSMQVALQIDFAENPTGISYDVYALVVEKDLPNSASNPDVGWDGTYLSDAWDAAWSYEEITSAGRSVDGTLYTLELYNSAGELNAVDPMADGLASALIDLSGSSDPELTSKYLLVGIVLRYENLSAPLHVICVDIE